MTDAELDKIEAEAKEETEYSDDYWPNPLIAALRAAQKALAEAKCKGFVAGLRHAAGIVDANGKPGPGGMNITDGVPSTIHVAIIRGRYSNDHDLAVDTARTVRAEITEAIERRIKEYEAEARP